MNETCHRCSKVIGNTAAARIDMPVIEGTVKAWVHVSPKDCDFISPNLCHWPGCIRTPASRVKGQYWTRARDLCEECARGVIEHHNNESLEIQVAKIQGREEQP